jgi:hypothetical protein
MPDFNYFSSLHGLFPANLTICLDDSCQTLIISVVYTDYFTANPRLTWPTFNNRPGAEDTTMFNSAVLLLTVSGKSAACILGTSPSPLKKSVFIGFLRDGTNMRDRTHSWD